MNKIIVRILALCLIACLSFTGCGNKAETVKIEPMEVEEVYALSFDFIGGKDVMPISGYWGPYPASTSTDGNLKPNTVTDQVFSDLAEAGLNHLSAFGWTMDNSPYWCDKVYEYAEKYGIAITQRCDLGNVSNVKIADEYLRGLTTKYKAFSGVFIVDEPSGEEYFAEHNRPITNFSPYFDVLNELGYFGFANLFPLYDLKQKKEYDDYVDQYLELCKPQFLSYDHYISTDSSLLAYFYNMTVIREKAEKNNISWWSFIGAGTDWFASADFENPTEYAFDWNINSSLAYGAKGIQYYLAVANYPDVYGSLDHFDTIDQEAMDKAATRIGILGGFGHRTRFWYYSKELMKHVKVIDEVLMNSNNKGVIATTKEARDSFKEDDRYILDGNSWRELKDVKGHAMIGCFNYNGKSAFYVVNFSREYAQKITLDFHNKYKMEVTQNGEKSYVETSQLELDMLAGEGVLIVME